MPTFSAKSQERLMSCHPDLQRLFRAVVEHVDCTILCGFRSKEDQDLAFETGKSKLAWPSSRHNVQPAMACDVAPWPLDWADTHRFREFAVIVKEQAARLGIKIRWGGDFPHFPDLDHFELSNVG